MTRAHPLAIAGCLCLLGFGPQSALAQQGGARGDGGPLLTFSVRSELAATDNFDLSPGGGENARIFDTRLSLGYRDRRANDTLSFDLSGLLRGLERPEDGRRLDNRTARFGYDREGVFSTLSLGAEYSAVAVRDRAIFDPDEFIGVDFIDETELSQDRGTREQISTRLRFETGLNHPLGLTLEGRYREQSFSGVTDPGLFESRTANLSGTLRFTLSPVTEFRLTARAEDYKADDDPETRRKTRSVSLGLTQALSQIDTLEASLGYQRIETEETVLLAREATTNAGLFGSIGLTREQRRGSIGTAFDLRRSVNGSTAIWRVNRTLELPRGALDVSLGVSSDVSGRIRPTGRANVTYELARASFTAGIEQEFSTSTQGTELRNTRASLGYRHEVNSLSQIAVSANFVEFAELTGADPSDTRRAEFRITYDRDLTRDWRLSSGYEHRFRSETGESNARSTRVFMVLERAFEIRP